MIGEYISNTLYHQINFGFIFFILIGLVILKFRKDEGRLVWIIKLYYISIKILQISLFLFIIRIPYFIGILDFIETIFPIGVILYNYNYIRDLYEDEIEV